MVIICVSDVLNRTICKWKINFFIMSEEAAKKQADDVHSPFGGHSPSDHMMPGWLSICRGDMGGEWTEAGGSVETDPLHIL